jgi:hypothetical protein
MYAGGFMKGLSDIHLYSRQDLMINGNPILNAVSDKLNAEINIPQKGFAEYCHSEGQIGSISVKLEKPKLDEIIKDLPFQDYFWQQMEISARELRKKINEYLETKCEDFCKKNCITTEVFTSFAEFENFNNHKWEVRYKGDLVCGVKVISEIKDKGLQKDVSVSLELY